MGRVLAFCCLLALLLSIARTARAEWMTILEEGYISVRDASDPRAYYSDVRIQRLTPTDTLQKFIDADMARMSASPAYSGLTKADDSSNKIFCKAAGSVKGHFQSRLLPHSNDTAGDSEPPALDSDFRRHYCAFSVQGSWSVAAFSEMEQIPPYVSVKAWSYVEKAANTDLSVAAARARPPQKASVKSEQHLPVPDAATKARLQDLESMMTEIRVIPYSAEGREGFKLLSLHPDSILKKLTLASGDIILSVNAESCATKGWQIDMPPCMIQLSDPKQLKILRDGIDVHLYLDLDGTH